MNPIGGRKSRKLEKQMTNAPIGARKYRKLEKQLTNEPDWRPEITGTGEINS